MSVFDRLREGIFRVRVVPKNTPEDETAFTNERDSLNNRINEAVEMGKRLDLTDLLNITTLKGDRNQKYAIFEEMVADGRIGAAVEMYANDTVQYSPDGKIIWVESNDTEVAKYGNKLLNDLNISKEPMPLNINLAQEKAFKKISSVIYKVPIEGGYIYSLVSTQGKALAYFKGRIDENAQNDERQIAFGEFVKQVFDRIKTNNKEVFYVNGDENSPLRDFKLYIAAPTKWTYEEKQVYKEFIENALGHRIEWVINESDAAFYNHEKSVKIVDEIYNPKSTNAQSGVAIAEAFSYLTNFFKEIPEGMTINDLDDVYEYGGVYLLGKDGDQTDRCNILYVCGGWYWTEEIGDMATTYQIKCSFDGWEYSIKQRYVMYNGSKSSWTAWEDVFTTPDDVKDVVNEKIAEIIDSAPEALDTLKELSEALNNDPDFAATIINQLETKADKWNVSSIKSLKIQFANTSCHSIPVQFSRNQHPSANRQPIAFYSETCQKGYPILLFHPV